jgi:hypothetical protein
MKITNSLKKLNKSSANSITPASTNMNASILKSASIESNEAFHLNPSSINLSTLLQSDTGRKFFTMFLKEFNNHSDTLLTLYLICCCFNNQKMDDRERIKQIMEKTYSACFIKAELPHLSADLKARLSEALQRKTYNESLFNTVKIELNNLLEKEYFPKFLRSKYFEQFNTACLKSLSSSSSSSSFMSIKNQLHKEQHYSDNLPLFQTGSLSMPPNPYHVNTKIVANPIDSEQMSTVSENLSYGNQKQINMKKYKTEKIIK